MNPWHEVSPGRKVPNEVNVVVEIPKNDMNKYELDKESGLLKLDRVLYSAVHYPGNYGFIPGTYWEDGDPMDALVISGRKVYPMTIISIRPVGILRMKDNKESDDKIIGVLAGDPRYDEIKDIKDLPEHVLKEIDHFFKSYKELQDIKVKTKVLLGAKEAKVAINKSIKMYNDEFSSACKFD